MLTWSQRRRYLCDLAFDKLKAHLTAALQGDVTGDCPSLR